MTFRELKNLLAEIEHIHGYSVKISAMINGVMRVIVRDSSGAVIFNDISTIGTLSNKIRAMCDSRTI